MSPNHLNLFVRWTVPMGTFMLTREMSGWQKKKCAWGQIEMKPDVYTTQTILFYTCVSPWVCGCACDRWFVFLLIFYAIFYLGLSSHSFRLRFFPFSLYSFFFGVCVCVLLTRSNQGLSNGWSVHCWRDLFSHELGKWRHFVFIWLQPHNML